MGDNFFFIVSRHQHGDGRPVGGVDVDVRMALETEQPIQGEPVVAAGIDTDAAENNDVENINHGAQPTAQTQELAAWSLLACGRPALRLRSSVERRSFADAAEVGPRAASLNCLSALRAVGSLLRMPAGHRLHDPLRTVTVPVRISALRHVLIRFRIVEQVTRSR